MSSSTENSSADVTPPLPPMSPNSKTISRDHVSYSIKVGDVSIGEIYETILDFEGDTVMLNKIYHNIFNLHQSKIKEGSLLNDTINSLSNTLNSLKTYSENYTFHNWLVPLYNTIILLTIYRMLKHINIPPDELVPIMKKIKDNWEKSNQLLD